MKLDRSEYVYTTKSHHSNYKEIWQVKSLNQTSFCRNLVAINIWNALTLNDVAIIKSDILKH